MDQAEVIAPAATDEFEKFIKPHETSRMEPATKVESRRSLQLIRLKANYSDSRELHRASSSRRKLSEVITFRSIAGNRKTLRLFYRFMENRGVSSLLEFWLEAESYRKSIESISIWNHRNVLFDYVYGILYAGNRDWKVLQILGIFSDQDSKHRQTKKKLDAVSHAQAVYSIFEKVPKSMFTPQMVGSFFCVSCVLKILLRFHHWSQS